MLQLDPSSRSQCLRGLRRGCAAARLLILRVRIPPLTRMFVSCECCVLAGRGPCDEMITRPEESHRLWCVDVCDLETSWMKRPWPTGGLLCQKNNGPGLLHYPGFTITLRRTTDCRTPLDGWSALRRDLYLTTHNIHNRRTSMLPVGFETIISASERPQTHALDRAATGIGT